MNMLLKERNAKIKEELTDINHQIDIAKTKIDSQSRVYPQRPQAGQPLIELQ